VAIATGVGTPPYRPGQAGAYQAAVWAVVVLLVAGPLAPLVYSSLLSKPFYLPGAVFTFDAYATLFADPAYWVAVRNSIEFAALTTVLAVPAGTLLAILCHRTDLPLGKSFALLLMAPIVIPHLGLIVGWVVLYARIGIRYCVS
jgi:iron(III) transport system permease protein